MDEVKKEDKSLPQEPVKNEVQKPVEGDKVEQPVKEEGKV